MRKTTSAAVGLAVLITAAAGLIIFILLLNRNDSLRAESFGDAADYLSERGVEVIFQLEKEITIPKEFGDVYERYNELQRESGFDISPHRGHSAKLYVFSVPARPDAHAHVIVCCGKIIGGDISSASLSGSMEALPK